jgi:Macrocin-O-methyltransferase (TylF)
MSNLCYRFLADNLHVKTAIGIRASNTIRIPKTSGTALYGPYVDLPPGRFEAVIRFDPDTPCQGRAMMDVCAGIGTERLTEDWITADQIVAGGMSARLEFSCSQPLRAVEVRLWVDGNFTAAIVSVEIGGELGEPTSELQNLSISDLPAPNVEDSIRKGRNLYEGYQRGVGLAFANLGARIAADPDFFRARALAANRTIVGDVNLWNIFLLVKFFLPRLPLGHIVEFGSYKGGSAIFMAALAEKFLPDVQVIGFDTFSGMPATDRAVDAHRAGGFPDVDLTELRQYVDWAGLRNLTFVQGYFEETAAAVLRQQASVALCHIDCDIRSAVECAYNTTKPYMAPGGYWVFDDPLIADCLGAAEAVEDLLIKRDGLNSEQLYPHYVFREPFGKVMRQ